MQWLLIPTHVAALVAWVFCVKWETQRNVELIADNGAKDSLKEAFHARRTFYRAAAALSLATLASLPLWHYGAAMVCSTLALQVAFGAYFVRVFNPALNLARGKHEYYASLDHRAALFPDRLAVYVARKAGVESGEPLAKHLATAYEAILRITFWLGCLVYACGMAYVVWLLK